MEETKFISSPGPLPNSSLRVRTGGHCDGERGWAALEPGPNKAFPLHSPMPSSLAPFELIRAVDPDDTGISPFPCSPCWRLGGGKLLVFLLSYVQESHGFFGSEYNREYAGVGEQRKMGVFSSIQSFLPSFPQLEHGEGPGKPRQVVAVAGVPGWRA